MGGLEETRHVFIDGNNLKNRFASSEQFVVGEIGFGSGLNFIATVDCWLQSAPVDARLHYISVEKHPFSKEDLISALNAWPELTSISSELCDVYPPLVHGFHYRKLFAGRVCLTLLFGDALELLPELNANVDAWFLDGFAPAKNQTLWSSNLFQLIAERTVVNGSFATFTSAGSVRRGLQAAGFTVSKRVGFGKKREMLTGSLASPVAMRSSTPWFDQTSVSLPSVKHAIVVGAGIAGMTTAAALAERGWKITLIERHDQVASEASGNPGGVVMPRLTVDMSIDARFYLSAFLYTTQWLHDHVQKHGDIGWHADGVIQLMGDSKLTDLVSRLPDKIANRLDEAGVSELIGARLHSCGILYPLAGWLEPHRLCEMLLQRYPMIEFRPSKSIEAISYDSGIWSVQNGSEVIASAPVLVIANGSEAGQLLPDLASCLHAVRGQLTYVQGLTKTIRRPVCYDGYVIPLPENQYLLGASYDRKCLQLELREADDETNLQALQEVMPDLKYDRINGGRVALRASTLDHLPLVGPVPDSVFYHQHYADLCHGRPAHRYPPAEYRPGLYINTGHGSRGLTSCPLAAELLASIINQESLSVAEDLRLALHPARFMVRNLKRSRRPE